MSVNLRQSWNPRSKKWVLVDCSKKSGILDMSDEKFPDIPVMKGQQNGNITKDPAQSSPENKTEENETRSEARPGDAGPAPTDPTGQNVDDPEDSKDDWLGW